MRSSSETEENRDIVGQLVRQCWEFSTPYFIPV